MWMVGRWECRRASDTFIHPRTQSRVMEPRFALIVAASAAVLAVALVAVDLQFEVHVELQENVDGEWRAVTGSFEERYPGFPGCVGQDLRLVVNNDRLVPFEEQVYISYSGAARLDRGVLVDEVWDIPARGVQDKNFTIPDSAFEPTEDGKEPRVFVDFRVGDRYYNSLCVEAEEGSP